MVLEIVKGKIDSGKVALPKWLYVNEFRKDEPYRERFVFARRSVNEKFLKELKVESLLTDARVVQTQGLEGGGLKDLIEHYFGTAYNMGFSVSSGLVSEIPFTYTFKYCIRDEELLEQRIKPYVNGNLLKRLSKPNFRERTLLDSGLVVLTITYSYKYPKTYENPPPPKSA